MPLRLELSCQAAIQTRARDTVDEAPGPSWDTAHLDKAVTQRIATAISSPIMHVSLHLPNQA